MIKKCLACSVVIEKKSNQWAKQLYCTTACRKGDHRKKKRLMSRVERRRSNLRQNDEMVYLAKQCRRAKTVEILKGHSLDSFIETIALVRNRPPGQVELCHIAPVKGDGSTGLFHCRNLFYAGAHQNRRNGRKYIAEGLFISNSKLKSEWAVDALMTTNEILIKIEKYMGGIIAEYIERVAVRKSRKVGLVDKITGVDPEAEFDTLILMSYRTLQERWAEISNIKPNIPVRLRESKYISYLDGVSRFISYGGERKKMLIMLRGVMVVAYMALSRVKASQTVNKEFHAKYGGFVKSRYVNVVLKNSSDWSVFKDLVYQAAFDALQGKTLDMRELKKELNTYLVLN